MPAEHAEHARAPAGDEYVPDGQLEQLPIPVDTCFDHVYSERYKLRLKVETWKYPAAHEVQVAVPIPEKVPAAQFAPEKLQRF